ncbi:hypothetical protein BGW38_001573 [Lunasporangiospora selenospora]|uniref:AD domain-containing protein n=1 Tax=Lunasporangiospora selenospora TaxID=979761 RepID=A0A9P6KHW8_9FUNG|nr:hypothetical protein BGW38_001573 [Lunasporangiospora selenospora]
MEPLTKKPSGIAGGISFASAAAGGRTPSASTVASNGAGNGSVTGAGTGAGTGTGTGTGAVAGTGASQGTRAAGASASSSRGGTNPSSSSASPALGSSLPSLSPSVTDGPDKTLAASASTSVSSASDSLDWILGLSVKVTTLNDEVFEGQVYAYDVIMNCVCPSKTQSASTTPTIPAYYSPLQGGSNGATNGNPRQKYDFRILKINFLKDVTPLKDISASPSGTTIATTDSSESPKGNNCSASPSRNLDLSSTNTTNTAKGPTRDITAAAPVTNSYATIAPSVGYVQLDKFQQREQQAVREAQLAAARIGVGVSSLGQGIFDALSKTLPCRWAKDSIVVMDEVIIAPPYEPENCKASTPSNALARVKKVLELERLRIINGRK